MSRIFISYKRVDKEKVFKIKNQIESALGEKCWIDLDGIESDAQFASVIIKAIDNAQIILFMHSIAHSKITDYENDWTVRELNYAKEKNKRIIFVNIDNAPLTDWFVFMFPQKQQVFFESSTAIEKLCNDLEVWLFPERAKERELKKIEEEENIKKKHEEYKKRKLQEESEERSKQVVKEVILADSYKLQPHNNVFYLLLIGRTGIRVLRSILILMASGEFFDKTIIPIILGADPKDEETRLTLDLLNLYESVSGHYNQSKDLISSNLFFSSSLKVSIRTNTPCKVVPMYYSYSDYHFM